MKNNIKLKINNCIVTGFEGETILAIAKRNGVEIPSLCHHPDFCHKGNCRVCVVEIVGANKLQTACSTMVSEGMEVLTESERVKKVRNINIELIYAEHVEKCATCVWRFECKLLQYAQKYKTKIVRFDDRKKNREIVKIKNALEIDGSQCIDCRNCISACSDLQKLDCLVMNGRGHSQEIILKDQKTNPCILCGQCALHCPVSAIQEQTSYADFERDLSDKEKTVVVVIDPIIEASLDEVYPDGNVNLNSVATVLKKMGVDYVFSSALGVEIISHIQVEQILEGDGCELFLGSQCPAFVNYIKSYQPELLKNLQKIKSPANLMGGIIKTYWAEKQKINPANISVVSIGVCVARKMEIVETGMRVDNFYPVDIALTLRELIFLFNKNKQQLNKGKINNFDSFASVPINLSSVSVFSSILVRLKIDNEINKFTSRGDNNFDDFILLQDGIGKKIGALKGLGNFDKIFKDLEKYAYLEIMACPDACFGGGGQLIPTNENLRKKRKQFFLNKRILKNFDRDILDEQIVDIFKWLKKHNLDKKILFRQ